MNNNGETVFHSSNSGIINTNTNNKNFDIPNNYKPLSPSSYFGYSVLFSIPLVGFIFLIVFSFNDNNINRRNFARSYWLLLLLVVIFVILAIVIISALGITFGGFGNI